MKNIFNRLDGRCGLFVLLVLLPFFSLSVGCGGDGFDRVPFSGTVSVDGGVNRNGWMRGSSATAGTGSPNVTAVIENGKFAFPAERGPVPGSYNFEVTVTVPGKERESVGEVPAGVTESNETYITLQKTLVVPEGGGDGVVVEVTSADVVEN
ncbi:hypothetical protein [Rosistilla ulvae]|uniref:hypothetical protein n=1 Tax=Rosistilla ulvae TaxID=1930277 RepID=UPI0011AAED62|nr:hypothetical protein [Rosistilla ulvae]